MTSPITPDAWQAIGLTLKLAALTTIILLLVATPIAWWLSQTRSKWRAPIGALVTLPLVLPPTVLGFYLLVLLGPQGWVGMLTQVLGLGLLSFSFSGILIGSIVFSLPFAVQPLQHAFESVGRKPLEAAATLGAASWQVQWRVVAPQAWQVALPALTGHAIGVLKDTALITVVGLHELNGSLGLSLNGDADWRPFFLEAYLAVGALYLAMGLALSALGRRLEAQLPGARWRD